MVLCVNHDNTNLCIKVDGWWDQQDIRLQLRSSGRNRNLLESSRDALFGRTAFHFVLTNKSVCLFVRVRSFQNGVQSNSVSSLDILLIFVGVIQAKHSEFSRCSWTPISGQPKLPLLLVTHSTFGTSVDILLESCRWRLLTHQWSGTLAEHSVTTAAMCGLRKA